MKKMITKKMKHGWMIETFLKSLSIHDWYLIPIMRILLRKIFEYLSVLNQSIILICLMENVYVDNALAEDVIVFILNTKSTKTIHTLTALISKTICLGKRKNLIEQNHTIVIHIILFL